MPLHDPLPSLCKTLCISKVVMCDVVPKPLLQYAGWCSRYLTEGNLTFDA